MLVSREKEKEEKTKAKAKETKEEGKRKEKERLTEMATGANNGDARSGYAQNEKGKG
jgi:hypothetical protein